ncbi:outer membrane beta-barrel protein [Mucilaginibacter sp. AW1-3]
MKKLAYIIILLTGFCKYAQGQFPVKTNLFFVGYQVAIPTNNNYLTSTSWSGFNFDYRYMIKPNISVGIGNSFNSFSQYFPQQTYEKSDGSGSVTSDMVRHIYTAPITASIHYYLAGKMIKPYVGIGMGAEYSEQDAYFNIYTVYSKNWGFVVKPEAGAFAMFSSNVGGFISVAYNYSTNSESDFHIDHLSHIPITVGFLFTAR